MTLMMYYIGLNIYIYIFTCVVKTHLCSTEAIDNVGLYNDVVIRAYNTDVLVVRLHDDRVRGVTTTGELDKLVSETPVGHH